MYRKFSSNWFELCSPNFEKVQTENQTDRLKAWPRTGLNWTVSSVQSVQVQWDRSELNFGNPMHNTSCNDMTYKLLLDIRI